MAREGKLASYPDALWAGHAFLPRDRGGRMRDQPKQRLRRRIRENRCKESQLDLVFTYYLVNKVMGLKEQTKQS